MGNAHNQFIEFEKAISLTKAREKSLIISRKAVEARIRKYFKLNPTLPSPSFWIQGSYKMKTMVLKNDNSYDVDLGVFFLERPIRTASTMKNHVKKAVEEHTNSGVENRDKCVRILYKGDFNIDLPVYYKTANDNHPYLATKSQWEASDPKELKEWFDNRKDKEGQLVRLVKYFKAWSYQQNRKMPSGIALTVWVANNYKSDNRDDKAFYKTAKAIETTFGSFWNGDTEVINPATPQDNLLKLDFDQRARFKEIFQEMLKQAEQALRSNNDRIAIEKWHQIFGSKFPKK